MVKQFDYKRSFFSGFFSVTLFDVNATRWKFQHCLLLLWIGFLATICVRWSLISSVNAQQCVSLEVPRKSHLNRDRDQIVFMVSGISYLFPDIGDFILIPGYRGFIVYLWYRGFITLYLGVSGIHCLF